MLLEMMGMLKAKQIWHLNVFFLSLFLHLVLRQKTKKLNFFEFCCHASTQGNLCETLHTEKWQREQSQHHSLHISRRCFSNLYEKIFLCALSQIFTTEFYNF